MISIAVDAMGGERSPEKVIKGCEIFLDNNSNVELIIFGKENQIINKFKEKYLNNITLVYCDEIIEDDDKPSAVLRTKKNSSMRKAIEFIK